MDLSQGVLIRGINIVLPDFKIIIVIKYTCFFGSAICD